MMALQAQYRYRQVAYRNLADVVTYRYFMDDQSWENLMRLAHDFGVDTFKCYEAPAGSGVDYLLAPDYLERHTQGVRSIRAYQPIPDPIMATIFRIVLTGET
jgi:hypothetical protein